MATLNIRQLPDDVHARLRVRAARNGRSMEAEARHILAGACDADAAGNQAGDQAAYVATEGSGRARDAGGDAPLTVTLDPHLARAASNYARQHHTTVEELVRQVLDRELVAEAGAWCDELFTLMDRAAINLRGQTWTRDELYERL